MDAASGQYGRRSQAVVARLHLGVLNATVTIKEEKDMKKRHPFARYIKLF